MHAFVFALLFFAPLDEAPFQLELDDLNPMMFFAAAGSQDRCLIVYPEFHTRPVTRLYLYDAAKGSGIHLEDGRLDGFRSSGVLRRNGGWVLWEASYFRPSRLALLDDDGRFIDTLRTAEIAGWRDGFSLSRMAQFGENKAVVTLEHYSMAHPEAPKIQPAVLDLVAMRLSLHDSPVPAQPGTLWLGFDDGQTLLQVNRLRGGIARFQLANRQSKWIRADAEIVEKNMDGALKNLVGGRGKIPAALKFEAALQFFARDGDAITCLANQYNADSQLQRQVALRITRNGRVQELGAALPIWRFPHQTLYYDFTEKRFLARVTVQGDARAP